MEFAPRGQSGFNNPLHGIFKIAKTEGPRGLYSGLLATILRDAPYSGLYFASYQYLVQSMDRLSHQTQGSNQEAGFFSGLFTSIPASGKNFLAAMAAGACATLVTQPADLIRTQQQIAVSAAGSTRVDDHIGAL
jgi:solute carrier family 25, member 38